MVVPDEVIKIFMFFTVFIVALNSFISGFSEVHPEISEVSSYQSMDEIPECQFSDESFNQRILEYPAVFTATETGWFYWVSDTQIIQDVWVESGSYTDVNIDTSSKFITQEPSLYLRDGEVNGLYTIDFSLRPGSSWNNDTTEDYVGTFLNTMELYADVGPDQNIGVDVRLLGPESAGYPVNYQNNYVINDENTSRHILDLDGYEVTPGDRWLRVSFQIDETSNQDYEAQVNEFSIYGDKSRTYEIRDYLLCSVRMVQSWGKSLFIDTGITVIDGMFTVLGGIMYVISIVISAVLLLLGIIVAVLTTFI